MPFWIPAIMAGTALAGQLLGRKKQETESSSKTEGQTDYSSSGQSTNRPLYDEEVLGLRNPLIAAYQNRLKETPESFLNAYKFNALRSINKGAEIRKQILQNNLAARGLSGSSVAPYALAGEDSRRVSDIVQMQSQLPMLQEQFTGNRLAEASKFLGTLPVGQLNQFASSGTQHSTQNMVGKNVTTGGGGLGGGLTDAASILAYLYGQGAFGGGNNASTSNAPKGTPPIGTSPSYDPQITAGGPVNSFVQQSPPYYGGLPQWMRSYYGQ